MSIESTKIKKRQGRRLTCLAAIELT